MVPHALPQEPSRQHLVAALVAVVESDIADSGVVADVRATHGPLRVEYVAGQKGKLSCVAIAGHTAGPGRQKTAGRQHAAVVAVTRGDIANRGVVAEVPTKQARLWVEDVEGTKADLRDVVDRTRTRRAKHKLLVPDALDQPGGDTVEAGAANPGDCTCRAFLLSRRDDV